MTLTGDRPAGVGEEMVEVAEGCYVYGVVAGTARPMPADLVGVADAPVELVGDDDLAAVVGTIDLDRPPAHRADLLAHDNVLSAVAHDGPVVPIQFGSVLLDSDDVINGLLEPERMRFEALLADLEGADQFTVRAIYNSRVVMAEVVASDPEVARLRRRTRGRSEEETYHDRVRLGELVAAAMEHKREQDAQDLLDVALPHVMANRVRLGSGLEDVADIPCLVAREERDVFEEVLEAHAEAVHERVHLQLLGPLPPYDFVAE